MRDRNRVSNTPRTPSTRPDAVSSTRPDFLYDPLKNRGSRRSLRSLAGKPKPNWWKRLIVVLAVLIALGGLGFFVYTIRNVIKVAPNFFKFEQKLKGEDEGRVNILLLGVGDPGHDGAPLSDTNILVSINTRDHQVAMTSVPRDTRVKIPGYGSTKINNANAYGGVDLAKTTVENFLGVPIHYYVKTDFTGLKQAVDAVGGVDVDNKTLLYDSEYPCDNNQWRSCGFKMQPGNHHVDGTTALKYARCRKGTCGDDFGRAARQQEVLTQIRTRAVSADTILNPAKLAGLVQAAGDNINTDLSIGEMLRINELTKEIPADQFTNFVLSIDSNGFLQAAPDGSSDLVPVDSTLRDIQAFVKDIFRLGPIWKEDPTIVIQNGTTTVGLGAKLEKKIAGTGLPITIAEVSNALTKDHVTTQILDYSNGRMPRTKAALESTLKVTATIPEVIPQKPTQDFVIIIGADYVNYLATPAPTISQ